MFPVIVRQSSKKVVEKVKDVNFLVLIMVIVVVTNVIKYMMMVF